MKKYSNPSRKPMMYGGMATKPKKKMESGGRAISDADKKAMANAAANASIQSRVATGRNVSDKDKALMEQQRIEELGRMTIPELRKIAGGKLSDKDTMLARKVLRDKGDKGAMPQSVDK